MALYRNLFEYYGAVRRTLIRQHNWSTRQIEDYFGIKATKVVADWENSTPIQTVVDRIIAELEEKKNGTNAR